MHYDDALFDYREDPDGMVMGPELLVEIKEKLTKTAPQYCKNRRSLFPPDGIEPLGD